MMRRNASLASRIRPSTSQTKIPMMLASTRRRIFASRASISPCSLVQRFQVSLQHVAKVQQELEISLAVFVPFVIANANGSEHLAIGPADRNAQVRDHPLLHMRVRFPRFVRASISDK